MKESVDLKKDLEFFYRGKQPLIIEWEAWIWKTAIVEEFAKEKNIPIYKVLASSLDETDIAWIVIYNKETNTADTISPLLAKNCKEPCIVFFDEINTARKEVQDTLLTLIQSRTFPNWDTIHNDVWFVAAQNPALNYNNYEMSPAMKNRFAWVSYKAKEKKFAEYLKKNIKSELYQIVIDWLEKEKIKFSDMNDDYSTFTSPRSISNLLKSSMTISELVEYAPSFVSIETSTYLKTINIKDKAWIENEIFDKSFMWFNRKWTSFIK